MLSHYAIIQYAPDVIRREWINVGVVVYNGTGAAKSLFVEDWGRVKQFAGHDVSFLKDIAYDAKKWDADVVQRLSSQWTGSVQVTPPAPSMLTIDELLIDATTRYLVEPATTASRGYRVKSDATTIARRRIREKLVERFGARGRAFLKPQNYFLRGAHKEYSLDVTVGNGDPLYGAEALSFEVPDWKRIDRDVNAANWLVRDVLEANNNFDIGVMVLPPHETAIVEAKERYKEAIDTLRDGGAAILTEMEFPQWAERMAVAHIPAASRN